MFLLSIYQTAPPFATFKLQWRRPRNSAPHSEILALKLLESLFVQQQMKRTHEVQLRLSERCARGSAAFAGVLGIGERCSDC